MDWPNRRRRCIDGTMNTAPVLAAPDSETEALVRAIEAYAAAYGALDDLQRTHVRLIPLGDQKTGAIAEFYARLYAAVRHPGVGITFGHTSEGEYDLRIGTTPRIDVQVKCVSDYSTTGSLSPVKPSWSELWLMRLDRRLLPVGLWTLARCDVPDWPTVTVHGLKMPRRGVAASGSRRLRDARDEYALLCEALAQSSPRFAARIRAR
jgi:hypothetical protein